MKKALERFFLSLSLLSLLLAGTANLHLTASAVRSSDLIDNGSGEGAVCPAGDLKVEIGKTSSQGSTQGSLAATTNQVTWTVQPGFKVKSVCVKVGGQGGGQLIYPKSSPWQNNTGHDVSHATIDFERVAKVPQIDPIFECWEPDPENEGKFIAHFGWENKNEYVGTISYGEQNSITPSSFQSHFPTYFNYPTNGPRPGRTPFYPNAAISISNWDGSNIVWKLTDQGTETASTSGPRCPITPPKPSFGSCLDQSTNTFDLTVVNRGGAGHIGYDVYNSLPLQNLGFFASGETKVIDGLDFEGTLRKFISTDSGESWQQKGGTHTLSISGHTEHEQFCEVEPIYGCTDPEASNYDPDATVDNESCEYEQEKPTPTPTVTPTPGPGIHADFGKSGPTCSNTDFLVTYTAWQNDSRVKGVNITFDYHGKIKTEVTGENGQASVTYGYDGDGEVKATADGGFPTKTLGVEDLDCATGQVLGASTEDDAPAIGGGQVLGATSMADTGIVENVLMDSMGVLGLFSTLAGSLVYAKKREE